MNICADCQNPVNTCCWEREFKPVPGWTAEKTKLLVQSPKLGVARKHTESYNVIDCPLFTPPPGFRRRQGGKAKSVISQNIKTGEETIYSSIIKVAGTFGVAEKTVAKCIEYGGILRGHRLRYEKAGDGK